jgi:hypothetical protein
MTDWRPIETAPKDETKILGWDPIGEACIPIEWHDADGDCGPGFYVCWTGSPNGDCTHWMPLPEPPK